MFLTKGKGYYEQYKAGEDYADYHLPYPINGITSTDLIRQLWLDNDFYGNIFSLQHQSLKTTFTFGGAFTKYDGTHFGKIVWTEQELTGNPVWYHLGAGKKDFNLYSKWQQQVSKSFQSFIDLQFRNVNYNINGFRDHPELVVKNDYQFFNPKLGFTFQKNGYQAYASYSIAHKEPNRDDFEAGINQQPKPEELHDIELGIESKNKKLNWSANVYYMKYKDQLALTGKINDVGAYTRTNIDDSYRLGIELQSSSVISTWLKLSGNLAFSRNKVKNFKEYIDDYDNGGQKENFYKEPDISFSPNIVGAATITLSPVEKLSIDLFSKYVGKQFLDNTHNETRKLDAFYTQDIRVMYSFNKKSLKNADIFLGVNNVFNKKYEPNGYTFSYFYNDKVTTENFYFPMAGVNWVIGVNLRF